MAEYKMDKVSFYVRKDFGELDTVYTRKIARGDSDALCHYICTFMQTTHGKGTERLGQLTIKCPNITGAFIYI